jgi:unsaturated rhamnogalacturonyl hydrolase
MAAEAPPEPDGSAARDALARLAAHAARELLDKKPHWGDAIECDGLLAAARALRAGEALASAERWFAPKLAAGPRLEGWFWFWAAEALPALNLHAATGHAAYLEYARRILDHIATEAARTEDGGITPHPPAQELWIDVAYFTAPAMALCGRILREQRRIERALDQLVVHWKHLADAPTGLFWHVAYVDKKRHSPCFWARGNSWFAIAATEVLAQVEGAPRPERLGERPHLIEAALAKQLNAIVSLQDKSGLWHTVIDRPDSYLESSASAGFALALGKALRAPVRGLDRERAARCYERAIGAIVEQINSAGEFTGVSQQTPPGDFDFYKSIARGTAPFGTGVCLMALSEALGREH